MPVAITLPAMACPAVSIVNVQSDGLEKRVTSVFGPVCRVPARIAGLVCPTISATPANARLAMKVRQYPRSSRDQKWIPDHRHSYRSIPLFFQAIIATRNGKQLPGRKG